MSTFNRGLDGTFVDAFNEEYDKRGWLAGLVNDRKVFLAIRENYVNFYYRGCSLLKLSCNAGIMVGEVHYKYLLRPDADDLYIKVLNGIPDLPADTESLFLSSLDDVDALKKAATPYAGDEKTGVHDILCANPNILDVEIAVGSGGSAPRMDLAAVQASDKDARIVLYEAKHFNNKALRAEKGKEPKVVEQMKGYSHLLERSRDAIIDSYKRVCCNLTSLHGMAERHPERHETLKEIVNGSRGLCVDTDPVLIVFGFDADQKNGCNWRPHRDKLRASLGDKLELKGDSKDFVRGISR